MTKSQLGRKGLFDLHFQIPIHHWRKPGQELKKGRELEVGADAEATDRVLLTALLLPVACSTNFLIEPRTSSPGMAPPRVGFILSHQSLIKKQLTAGSHGSIFSTEDPFIQITVAHVKLV